MMLTIILGVGISHKVQTVISLALTIDSLIHRVVMLALGVATLLSLSRFFIIRLGVLGTIRVGILNQSSHQLPMSLQWRLSRPSFCLRGIKWQFFSNIKTAEPALMRSDECRKVETRRTQWVVDSPSS